MAEEDVQYASVTFKNKNQPQARPEREEETVYDDVKVNRKTTQEPPDANGLLSEKEKSRPNYKLLAVCFGVICLVLVLNIVGFVLYELRITKLGAENQNLTSQIKELKKNLTEQIQKLENINALSVTQKIVDGYCPKVNNERKCKPCEDGWLLQQQQSSCYVYNNATPADQRSWAGARDDCRGKFSDFPVIADVKGQRYVINNLSPVESGINGYWIGLRAVNGTWKWIDGTDLTNQTWVKKPAADGQCVTSLKGSGWRSASCNSKKAWICEKKALSV